MATMRAKRKVKSVNRILINLVYVDGDIKVIRENDVEYRGELIYR